MLETQANKAHKYLLNVADSKQWTEIRIPDLLCWFYL